MQLIIFTGGMPVDAKKVFEKIKLKGEPTKQKVTLYLDIGLHKELKKLCESEGSSISEAVEELIRELLESAKGKK